MRTDRQNRSLKSFPFYSFRGTYREIGQQYGEECRSLINLHKEYALERLNKAINVNSKSDLENAALEYREYVIKYAPYIDEELQGLAEGADISLGEAYFLQLRAEIYNYFDTTDECTTFAVAPEASKDGSPMSGQNADLPDLYKEVGVVIESLPENDPGTLMLTPAGQISYIGINSEGMGVCANFLECAGWRVGFPRYLLSRLALTKNDIFAAEELVQNAYRASSRNLLMIDKNGHIISLETVPERIGKVLPERGILAHANHFISNELSVEERKEGEDLKNSQIRYNRMKYLLEKNYGKIEVDKIKEILRDREQSPHTLCRMPGDFSSSSDVITFASVIAEPTKGNLWVAVGPPNEYEYKLYTFS